MWAASSDSIERDNKRRRRRERLHARTRENGSGQVLVVIGGFHLLSMKSDNYAK